MVRKWLPRIIATILQHEREYIEPGVNFEWSDKSWTHNVCRFLEMYLGRRRGIRAEITTTKTGLVAFHSFESVIAYAESWIRGRIPRLVPYRIYFPQLASSNGITFSSPYLFAIAVDVASQGSAGSVSPGTWSHTCTGSNLLLFVSTAINNNVNIATSASYNAVAMTDAGIKETYTTGGGTSQIFYQLGPSTGANTVSVSFNGGFMDANAASYSGVNQTGQPDGTGIATTNSATTLTCNVTVTASNCWIIAAVANNGTATSAGAGTFLRQQGSNVLGALYDTNGTVGTGTQSVIVNLGSANAYCISAASFAPSGGGGATAAPIPLFTLMGVGAQ